MARKITVKVKPYKRKAFTARRRGKLIRVKAARVGGFTKRVKDVGLPGKTPASRKFVPPLKPGALGISFDEPANVRRATLIRKAKREGERTVMGKLRAIQVLTKNTNPAVSRKAREDARYIAGKFVGHKEVREGEGFRRKR